MYIKIGPDVQSIMSANNLRMRFPTPSKNNDSLLSYLVSGRATADSSTVIDLVDSSSSSSSDDSV